MSLREKVVVLKKPCGAELHDLHFDTIKKGALAKSAVNSRMLFTLQENAADHIRPASGEALGAKVYIRISKRHRTRGECGKTGVFLCSIEDAHLTFSCKHYIIKHTQGFELKI